MAYTLRFTLAFVLTLLCVVLQYSYIFKASVRAAFPDGNTPPRILQSCVASAKGGKLVGSNRDCQKGEGPVCSVAEPCTPCDRGLSCDVCSASNRGACGFVEGWGPYCDFGGGVVGACRMCCSM